MKNCVFIILIATLLFTTCESSKIEEPKATATITFSPITTWKKDGFAPLIYEGDTVKYNITAKANTDITELNVYKVIIAGEQKTLLPGYPKTTFADKRNVTDQVYMPVGTKADFKPFYLSIESKESSVTATKKTNKYEGLSEVTVQRGLEISKLASFSGISDYQFTSNDNLLSGQYSYVLIFLFDHNNTKLKFGFSTNLNYNDNQIQEVYNYSSYIKVDDLIFDNLNSPDVIRNNYSLRKANAAYYQKNVVKDNVFLAKFNPVYNDTINTLPTFGVVKINEFYQASQHIDSYMKFDVKLYNPYRFK